MRFHRLRSRLWPTATAVAVAAVTAAGGTATGLVAHAATVGCKVTYSISSQWQGGFTAEVNLTNLGDPVSTWTLSWNFADGQRITQAWDATLSQSGAQVTARNATYNGNIATGASVSFGFDGSWNGSNQVPSEFSMNGTPCTGTPSTGSPPPVSPSPSPSVRVTDPVSPSPHP